eukprot:gene18343-20187_t
MATSIQPEKFESGDIVSWLKQFEVCATANSWDAAKKTENDQKDSYAHLAKGLREVLCPAIDREKFFAAFEQMIMRPNEDLSLFLYDLKDALSKADPTLQEDARHALLSRQFLKGLPAHLCFKLLEHNPTPSLKEMGLFNDFGQFIAIQKTHVLLFKARHPTRIMPMWHDPGGVARWGTHLLPT